MDQDGPLSAGNKKGVAAGTSAQEAFCLPSLAIRLQGKGRPQAAGRVEQSYVAPNQLVGAVGECVGASALSSPVSDYARSRAAGTQAHIV